MMFTLEGLKERNKNKTQTSAKFTLEGLQAKKQNMRAQTNPQHAQLAQNLANATSIRTMADVKPATQPLKVLNVATPSGAGDTTVLPQTAINEYAQKKESKILKTPEIMKDNARRIQDGYDFGDLTMSGLETIGEGILSVGGTVADVGLNALKGVMSVPENMAKAGASVVAGTADLFGADDWANQIRRNVAYKNIYTDPIQKGIDAVDKASVTGEFVDDIASGIGQVGGTVATTYALGKAGLDHVGFMPTTAILQGAGSASTEAYQKADESVGLENMKWQDKLQTAIKIGGGGLTAGAAEGLVGMFGVGGTPFTTKISNAIISKVSGPLAKVLTKMGLSGLGEMGEEFVEYVGNVGLNNLIDKIGNVNYLTEYDGKEIGKEMLSSFIVAALTQGGSSSLQMNKFAKQEVNRIENELGRKLTQNEIKQVANNIADQLLLESEKNIAPESTQMQETTATNEVIPQEGLNQNTANVVQNTANVQNAVRNESNFEKISQNNAENAQNLQKTVQNDTERFSQQVDAWKNNTWNPKEDLVVLEHTPQLYQNLGLRDLAITVNPEKLTSIYYAKGRGKKNYHGLEEIVKQIPEALKNPLNIVESNTRDNSIVVITDLADKNGNIITVPISIDDQGNLSIEDFFNGEAVNKMSSAYGRGNYDYNIDKKGNYYDGWMEDNLKNNRIIYDIDDGIIKKRVNGRWLQLPNAVDSLNITNDVLIDNIIQPAKNYVNSQQENMLPTAEELNKPSQEMIEGAQALTLEDMGTKTRRFTETARNVPGMPEEYRKAVKNNPNSQYQPVSNQETLEKAAEIIANNENIEQDFIKNDLRFAEDTAVGELLIKKALEEGDFKKANDLTAELAIKLTNAGQVIQAAALIKRMTPAGMLLYGQKQLNNVSRTIRKENESFYNKLQEQGIINKDGTIELTEDESKQIVENMKKVEKMEDGREKDILVGKTMAIISNKIPSTALEKVASLRRSGLLLNLKTLSRNVGSNATMSVLEAFKDIPATALDALVSLATGQRTTKLPSIKAYWRGFGEGAKNAAQDVYLGIDTSSTKNGKYEISKKGKAFKRENTYKEILKLYKDGKAKEATKATFKRLLSDYEDTSTFMVDGTDKPFWVGRFETELKRQMDLAGLKYGEDLPTTEMLEIATEEADYTTFKNKTKISDVFAGMKRTLNAGKAIGAADALGLTFTNVPGNISSKVIDYTIGNPKQMIKELYNLASKNGKFNQRKFVDGLARSITGTGAITLGALLIKEGILRGSNDDDEDIANMEQAMGLQENSINVSALKRYLKGEDTALQEGDEFYTFDWNQPFAATWIMGADIYKAIQNDESAVWAGVKSAVNQIADMSSISTVSKLLRGYSGEDIAQNVAGVLLEFPASFIPTIFNNIGQYTDEYSRQTKDATSLVKTSINKILNKLPGARETLEKKVDTLGQDVIQYKDGNDFMSTFVDPGYSSTYKPTELQKELLDVYKETGKNSVFPTRVNNSITYQNESKKLTSKEITTYQKTTGQYAKETMEAIINTPYYDTLDAEERASLFSKVVEESNFIGKASVGIETKDYIKYKEKQEKLENAGIPLEDYYNSWAAQKDIEGIPGPNGKTLSGSKSRLKKEAIDKATADLDKYQRRVLYEMFNVGESVW